MMEEILENVFSVVTIKSYSRVIVLEAVASYSFNIPSLFVESY